MLEIDSELRLLYENDYIPARDAPLFKQMKLFFPELNLTIQNENIVSESFELTESLCSDSDLKFGACEGAQVRFTVADIDQDLTGKMCVISQEVDGRFIMPFGTYVIDSAKKQDDLRFKDIIAYDNMRKLDQDVTGWYNSLVFPLLLKEFRLSLLRYLGIRPEPQDLINDDITINKTIEPTSLMARTVAEAIGEINAAFGHFNRYNGFQYITLDGLGLYPSETLFPSEDLYPSEPSLQMGATGYKSCKYEEYKVKEIESLQIRQEEGDIGYTAGSGDNSYIIQGNFLVYGKSAAELQVIAERILGKIKIDEYRPHTTVIPGLPYLEVGDSISVIKNNDTVASYIFSRTLKGIQCLEDTISAAGSETRENKVDAATEIKQLQNKTLRIDKNVDQVVIDMTDMEKGLESKISQTVDSITTEVKRAMAAEDELNSTMKQTAESITAEVNNVSKQLSSSVKILEGEIALRVTQNEVDNSIRVAVDGIHLSADKISLEGLTTVNGRFKIYNDGSAEMKNGEMDGCYVKNGLYYKYNDRGIAWTSNLISVPDGDKIYFGEQTRGSVFPGSVEFRDSISINNVNTSYVNGSTPVTESNITDYTRNLPYASSSHEHSSLYGSAGQVFVGNAGFAAVGGGMNLGSGSYRWSTVYCSDVNDSSDLRLKENKEDLGDKEIEFLMSLRPIKYNRLERDKKEYGLGAQDVEKAYNQVFGEEETTIFSKEPVQVLNEDTQEFETKDYQYGIAYRNFIPILIKAVQDQQKEINELKERIAVLERQVIK